MSGDVVSILWVVGFILGAYGVVLWLGTVVWAYRDICERTRDGWSQVVAVTLVALLFPGFPIPGLVLYLVLRPHETLTEAYERRLEAEALMQEAAEQRRSCPSCQRPAGEEFLFCPHCRTKLKEPCSDCGRALALNWIACPYCGAQGPEPAVTPTAPAAEASPSPGFQPPARATAARPAPDRAKPSEAAAPEGPQAAEEQGASSPAAARGRRTRPSPQAGPPPGRPSA